MFARSATATTALLGVLACAGTPAPTGAAARTDGQSSRGFSRADPGVIYTMGASVGQAFVGYALDEDEARELSRGMMDGALGKAGPGIGTPEAAARIEAFTAGRLQEAARREETAGAPMLESAAREPGAVRTDSGMVLRVMAPGSGPSPTPFDYVRVNYSGTLRDGKVFDTNHGSEPFRVQLGTTTRCWQEALGAVAAGARLHVVCPPDLSYGWGGWQGVVPGGAVVAYDFDLISVEPKKQ